MSIKDLKPYFENYLMGQGFDVRRGGACPVCGGGHKTPCFHYNNTDHRVKCFSCNWGGDFVDYLQETEKLSKNEAIEKIKSLVPKLDKIPVKKNPIKENGESQDFTSFYQECANRADQCDYLQRRGISVDLQRRFLIGYCPEWRNHITVERWESEGRDPLNIPSTPRIIIPTAIGSYFARDVRSEVPQNQKNYEKQKVGPVHIFNKKILRSDVKTIFIVEGEIDALSVIEVGGQAVGLGSKSNIRKLLEELDTNDKRFVILPDNDENGGGLKSAENLKTELDGRGLISMIKKFPDMVHDANDFLVRDRQGLQNFIRSAEKEVESLVAGAEFAEAYAINDIDSFLEEIRSGENNGIPTGFNQLDKSLDGGIFPGLFILGAESSLGKSTIILNMAEQLAENGTDVIYFSLEMSKRELIARGISRQTFLLNNMGECVLNKTTKQILKGNPDDYSDAVEEYKKIAKNLIIYEDQSGIDINDLKTYVENHVKFTGKSPVVILDYLQLIAPIGANDTDKMKMDYTVKGLKQLSQKLNIPVIAISSINREGYGTRVSMKDFKESGAIEFSSDVLLGLNLTVTMTGKPSAEVIDGALNAVPRKMTLEILKNRNGERNKKIAFKYFSGFNCFVEDDFGFAEWTQERTSKKISL